MMVWESFWATQAPVLPVLLPSLTAVLLLLLGDRGANGGHDDEGLALRRAVSLGSVLLGLLLAIGLFWRADAGDLMVYRLGEWPAPFGIVLVLDRLSALMLLLTSCVALPVLWYASGGWDSRGRYFHALFQFQLMGLNGAFVTGDLFNLFVFFEVLLIASYVLLVHGQGRERFRMGVHYVVLNLAASGLFLIGLGLLYAAVGTLNMVDVALRVAQLTGDAAALAGAAAMILLVVFGLKAALVPLYFWLPATYAAASAPVAALFAIMTKVGVYSIVRVHAVIFGVGAGELSGVVADWLLPLALVSSMLGVLGALAAHTLGRLVAYLTVASVGTILAAVGLFSTSALSAALYYTLHSTLVMAALFLLVELIASQRAEAGDRLRPAPVVQEPVRLGLMLLLGAASVAGLPPLPGFIGKLMILESAHGLSMQAWVWGVMLTGGFFAILGLARAGVVLFWHVEPNPATDAAVSSGSSPRLVAFWHVEPNPATDAAVSSGSSPRLVAATASLLALGLAMTVFAAPLKRYTDATAQQLSDKAAYAAAVLADGGSVQTTKPYRGQAPSRLAKETP